LATQLSKALIAAAFLSKRNIEIIPVSNSSALHIGEFLAQQRFDVGTHGCEIDIVALEPSDQRLLDDLKDRCSDDGGSILRETAAAFSGGPSAWWKRNDMRGHRAALMR
jgi:hypothetical protein